MFHIKHNICKGFMLFQMLFVWGKLFSLNDSRNDTHIFLQMRKNITDTKLVRHVGDKFNHINKQCLVNRARSELLQGLGFAPSDRQARPL